MKLSLSCPAVLLAIVTVALAGGCSSEPVANDYLARVGDRTLTREDLQSELGMLSTGLDSSVASQRLIDKWVTDEVLYNAAVRRGLANDPDVRRQLQESERVILISKLTDALYNEEDVAISRDDLEMFYDTHLEQLAITEPFIRFRYVLSDSLETAIEAAAALKTIVDSANPDSLWSTIADRFMPDDRSMYAMSESYYPMAQVTAAVPGLPSMMSTVRPADVLGPFDLNGQFHVLQLVDRLEPGTVPTLDMIEAYLRTRVTIDLRKQILARQVQRLRNEAIAREELELR
jgi:hypothetical protein